MAETVTAPPPTAEPAPPAPNPANPATPPSPVKFADKYDSPEALEKGYREIRPAIGLSDIPPEQALVGKDGLFTSFKALELAYKDAAAIQAKGLAKPPAAPGGDKAPPKPAGDIKIGDGQPPPAPTAKGIAKVLQTAGLAGKEQEMATTWSTTGKLADEHYAGFEKAGIDREMVDAHFAGQQALAVTAKQVRDAAVNEAVKLVGTREQFDLLVYQAKDFVPPDEIADFNARLNDPKRIKGATRDLLALHAESLQAGKSKPLINGSAPNTAEGAPITTIEEFSKIKDAIQKGDKAAIARLNNTPLNTLMGWSQ